MPHVMAILDICGNKGQRYIARMDRKGVNLRFKALNIGNG